MRKLKVKIFSFILVLLMIFGECSTTFANELAEKRSWCTKQLVQQLHFYHDMIILNLYNPRRNTYN